MKPTRCLAALMLAWLGASSAHADVISEPPPCPTHSEPIFCHGPPTCAPRDCLGSRDCAPGEHCGAVDLCIEEHSCGGSGTSAPETHVFGLCRADGTCASGMCSWLFVCTPGAGDDASTPRDAAVASDAGDGRTHAQYGCGCRCAVGAPARGNGGWLVAVAALAIACRHRSRRIARFPRQSPRVTLTRS